MIICPYCAAEISDDSQICPVCGNQLTIVEPFKIKKRRQKRSLLLKLGLGVIALAFISGAILWLLNYFSPSARLRRSVDLTFSQLIREIKKQDTLNKTIAVFDTISDTEKVSVYLETVKTSEESYSVSIDYNHSKQRMSGSIIYNEVTTHGKLNFAIKKGIFQIELPDVSPNVYGFSLDDLKESKTIQVAQDVLGANIGANQQNLESILGNYIKQGSNLLDEIWRIAEVESLKKQEDCTVYRITWTLSDLTALFTNEYPDAISANLYNFLKKVDGGFTCYVHENGCLTKVEAVVGVDLYTLTFSDADNLWHDFYIKSSRDDIPQITGSVSGDGNEFKAVIIQGDNKLFEMAFIEDSHAFGVTIGEHNLNGFLHSSTDSSGLQCVSENGTTTKIELGKLNDNPELISKDYTNLLDMSVGEISDLAVRLASSGDVVKSAWDVFCEMIEAVVQ